MTKLKNFSAAALFALAVFMMTIPATRTEAQGSGVVIAPGFEMNIFADPASVPLFGGAYTGPGAMTFDSRGRLFVATLGGKILILLDNDDNGAVDEVKTFATGIPLPLGLEFHANGDLYVTSNIVGGAGRVLRLRDTNGDDAADETDVIIDNLPSDGQHQTNKLKFGKDGLLYIGQGSSSNHGVPEGGYPGDRPLNSKILRVDTDNPAVEVFASGLRNPFGLGIHPENGAIFATDAGSGDVGENPVEDTSPVEEVNWIVQGGNYGFPLCEGTPDVSNPDCAGVRRGLIEFLPHTTPTAIQFYTGPQSEDFLNQMLVTLFVRYRGQGGDLRRFTLAGDVTNGFEVIESAQLVDFGYREEDDGPVDIAIDPVTGDIYVSRVDLTPAHTPANRRNYVYRIHRAGSDSRPFIGTPSPSSIEAGSTQTITVTGRHFKPGATIFADGAPMVTRQGAGPFELQADLFAPQSYQPSRVVGAIQIEVRNADGLRSNIKTISVTSAEEDTSPRLTSLAVIKKKNGRVVASIEAGSKGKKYRLVVNGERFSEGAQLFFNGAAMQVVESSATRIVGAFTNSMLASAGEFLVEARNSDGKVSNALRLTIAP
ncbi:MAG: PQQ-dependent sugar dehydrogenase [Acidobacteriota bacterium]